MIVTENKPEILCLEFKQEKGDKYYGSCLWARFYFNLERYELMIVSDCGNYGYKWYETPNSESFLELMARVEQGYLMCKLYGRPDIFDYEATKTKLYNEYGDDTEDKKKLDEIFQNIEDGYTPESGEEFIRIFDEENDGYFYDTFEFPVYVYPANTKKICEVFVENVRPKIKEILKRAA